LPFCAIVVLSCDSLAQEGFMEERKTAGMTGKRISSLLGKFTVIVILSCCSLSAQGKYGGGTGEPNDPYLIYDANQMNAIGADANDWDKYFMLMADIDLGRFTGQEYNTIGSSPDYPVYGTRFTGVFDGNGHTISNFTYTSTGTNYIGLFGYVEGGQIKNLGLIDPNVDAGTNNWGVGSLVGYLRSGIVANCYAEEGSICGKRGVGGLLGVNWGGVVTDCHATCSVSEDYPYDPGGGPPPPPSIGIGGLAGWNGGTITDCYSDGDVYMGVYVGGLCGGNGGKITNSYATGDIVGDKFSVGGMVGVNHRGTIIYCCAIGSVVSDGNSVGGMVGWNSYGTITNCYSEGDVLGDCSVGGLVGTNGWCYSSERCYSGTLSHCYSTGSVSGNNALGGLVGHDDLGVYTSSFWDNTVNPLLTGIGNAVDPNVIGESTANMRTESMFTNAGWDFVTPVWIIDDGNDYPRLWWEYVPILHEEPETTLGTTNTISWEPITGNIEYYAECSTDTNFTNIICNSGWITETSYEFTGLQLDQRYWYSVKARNSAGIESQWTNVESSLQCTLSDAVETMLSPESLKNKNMKNALLNKIDEALEMMYEGLYRGALNKLQNGILQKTNGCAEMGEPDKNDWIITCEEQSEVYPLIIETIESVRSLME
jgi:hypothetical protein